MGVGTGNKRTSNNQMHVNECHRTLFQMSDGLRFANRLFALQRLWRGTRQ